MTALLPRRLLGGLAALAVAPVACSAIAAGAHPDAALLAACADHARLAAEEHRLLLIMQSFDVKDMSPPARAAERAWDAAGDRAAEALERVMDTPAATMEGIAAKGRAVLTYWRSIGTPSATEINFEERGALSVLQDLERVIGGGA